jgi:hypothetical protein
MTPAERMQEARQTALLWRPWYCPFLVKFQFIPREGRQPLFHDTYGRIYYNEGYVAFAEVETLAVSLLQIAEMFTRGYQFRGMGREPMLWNFACLLDTASSLQKQGFKLSRESLKPGWFSFPPDKTAEWYYEMLKQKERFTIPFTALDKYGHPKPVEVEMWYEDGKLQFSMPDFAMVGGVADTPEGMEGLSFMLDPLLLSGIQQEVFDAAAEFEEHIVGEAPDWLLRRGIPDQSRLPWHQHIRDFLGDKDSRGASAVKYSFLQPSLLSSILPKGMVLPSVTRKSPNLVLVIDTSGSMDQTLLARALGETDGILRSLQIEDGLTVVPTDATAHTVQKVFRASQLDLEGSGGTDLGTGLDRVSELPEKADAVIVFTDGYTPWPEKAPSDFPVMVVVVSKKWPEPGQKANYPAPSWAKLVEMFPYTGESSLD